MGIKSFSFIIVNLEVLWLKINLNSQVATVCCFVNLPTALPQTDSIRTSRQCSHRLKSVPTNRLGSHIHKSVPTDKTAFPQTNRQRSHIQTVLDIDLYLFFSGGEVSKLSERILLALLGILVQIS